jgi:hypothetical protein
MTGDASWSGPVSESDWEFENWSSGTYVKFNSFYQYGVMSISSAEEPRSSISKFDMGKLRHNIKLNSLWTFYSFSQSLISLSSRWSMFQMVQIYLKVETQMNQWKLPILIIITLSQISIWLFFWPSFHDEYLRSFLKCIW